MANDDELHTLDTKGLLVDMARSLRAITGAANANYVITREMFDRLPILQRVFVGVDISLERESDNEYVICIGDEVRIVLHCIQ